MSKSLAEKWKNGTLSLNYYYIKLQSWKYGIDHTVMSADGDLPKTKFAYSDFATEEVLAPIPSYEQFIGLMDDSKELDKAYDKIKLLEKKLSIATKALEQYANSPIGSAYHLTGITACIALKEMEGVK